MHTLILFLALAVADELPASEAAAAAEAPEISEEPVETAASTAELMEDALRRLRLADYPGARMLLDQASDRDDSDAEEIAYLRGVSFELDRDYGTALSVYTAALEQFPAGHRQQDLRFRSAEVIGGLGRAEEALERLAPFLADLDSRPHADQIKIRLVEGIWLIDSGKVRKGKKVLAAALSEAGPDEVTFYQAKARATIAAQWAEESEVLHLDARERKQVKRLTERGERLIAIERQVTQVALLKEPEWVLDGLLTLGDAYASVGEDLLAARMPPKLAPELHDLYRQTVREKAEVVLVKALNHYQRGIDLSLELGWQSRRVAELEDARESLAARIETLAL
ncbi:MAG: hypothetical protein EP330_08360 [Deltaproteobacteria bacterium]|nr:MAG: hypothetical protein EP330_08360 [Deltaproteobacteria bacterium]